MRATIIVTADGRYVDADDAALELFGVSRDAFLVAGIGTYSGPHGALARTLWRRQAATGEPMLTGEASVHRPDGLVIGVRYDRITRLPDGTFRLEIVASPESADVPVVDDLRAVLERWRRAERAADAGEPEADVEATALRALYHHGARAKAEQPRARRRRAAEPPAEP